MSSKNRQAFKKQEDYVEFKLEQKKENRKKKSVRKTKESRDY